MLKLELSQKFLNSTIYEIMNVSFYLYLTAYLQLLFCVWVFGALGYFVEWFLILPRLFLLIYLYAWFSVVTTLLASLSLYLGTLNAAKLLHRRILFNIMRVPVTTFFDVTPLGRVLNRFSKDIDTLDNVLPMTLRGWVSCLYSVSTFNFAKAVIFKLFLLVKYYSRLQPVIEQTHLFVLIVSG